MTETGKGVLAALVWATLGGWIAAMLLFGAVVAPAAFRVLPTPELAGRLVGHVLAVLHLAGATLAVVLAVLGALLERGRLATLLPLVLAALCLMSHFGVSAPLAEMAGPARVDPEQAGRFAALHRLSETLFGATLVGALVLAGIHARAARRGPPPRR